jgi:ribulose-phosphate 3-epimerase
LVGSVFEVQFCDWGNLMNVRPYPGRGDVNQPVIAPSMLKCDFGDLRTEIAALAKAKAEVLHWDVMDGHFVPNLSYGAMVIAATRPLTEMFFDAHLMISEPERYLDDYIAAGCDAITVHIEAVPDPGAILKRIRSAGLLAGLTFNPKTPVSALTPYLAGCDLVLTMSVQPGFGGQKFIPEVLPKIRELKGRVSPETILSIDGGIGLKTIGESYAAGARLFVAGSSVFDESDYGAAVAGLERDAIGG